MTKKYYYILGLMLFAYFGANGQYLSADDKQAINEHLNEIENAKEENNKQAIAEHLYEIGFLYNNKKMEKESIAYFKDALNYTNQATTKLRLYNNLGFIYQKLADYKKAIEYFELALGYQRSQLKISTYNRIGDLYVDNKNYKSAAFAFEKSLKLNVDLKYDKSTIKMTIESLIDCYDKTGNTKKMVKYRKALMASNFADVAQIIGTDTPAEAAASPTATRAMMDDFEKALGAIVADTANMYRKYAKIIEILEVQNQKLDSAKQASFDSLKLIEIDLETKTVELISKEDELSYLGQVIKYQRLALGILVALLLIIIVLSVIAVRNYHQKRKDNKLLEEQSFQLKENNLELKATLDNLQAAQRKLVQSEKLASLGQLVAGIAHELNTPLGAIKSSITNVNDTLRETLILLPKLIKTVSDFEFSRFLVLVEKGVANTDHITSREERAIKRNIRKFLEEKGVPNESEVADILVDMGVYQHIENFILLLKSKHQELIMKTGYNLAIQFKSTDNINNAVNRASKIIFALKSYSHSSSEDEKQKVDIIKSIETILTLYHNQLKNGIVIEKNFRQIPEISCFPDELSQVWTNIIYNSIQAMSGNGKMTISTVRDNQQIIISFTDTGKGIPDEIKDRIFEPFFTTKKAGEGTGLGLDIIHKIIEKHDGEITFETELGVGTTFFVKLPVV